MNLPAPDKEQYLSAKPFPHLVIDNFLHPIQIETMLHVWPKEHDGFDPKFKKGYTNTDKGMGCHISGNIRLLFQSQRFIGYLEQLTGINGLVLPYDDPSLHETFPGGHLAPHLDYTINPRTGLQHRVNAILYLNENWKEEYGGNLELYDSHRMHGGCLTKPSVSIQPIFNRIAIFNIDTNSWHGASKTTCPEGMSRKSIAINYMSVPQKNAVSIPTTFKPSMFNKLMRIIRP